ncbi:hypothetical protein HHK36_016729 [Tetracentron sinense]|uniref:Nucleotide-diphospho-sugar transferase domain-containing protein n=1 Tax=Tetracentron sinense TaxID=13715 RepID=A0A834Z5T8_TETSI|nr:hypothetical protein HHK36_016729 [Tetracentron sinense]
MIGYKAEKASNSGALLRRILKLALILGATALSCVVLYNYKDVYPFQLLPRSSIFNDISSLHTNASSDSEELSLEKVLKEAAMEDRTVILTTLNEAWASPDSIIDLFLESFQTGDHTRRLLDHLVVIALDQKAYARCMTIHNHCFSLVTEGVNFSGEAYFMNPEYLKMMWRRIDFLRTVLEMGYNFIFTDSDIMWLRDPFPRFYVDADFQIACDHFEGNSYDMGNMPNGGFNYVISNNRSIEFYKFWYLSRETYPEKHDQDVLNMIKNDKFITDIGLKMRFLDTAYFGGFCEPSKDLNLVCTMHANCCFGLDNKLHDLRIILEDWKKFMSLSPTMKNSSLSSWRVPQHCSYYWPSLRGLGSWLEPRLGPFPLLGFRPHLAPVEESVARPLYAEDEEMTRMYTVRLICHFGAEVKFAKLLVLEERGRPGVDELPDLKEIILYLDPVREFASSLRRYELSETGLAGVLGKASFRLDDLVHMFQSCLATFAGYESDGSSWTAVVICLLVAAAAS